MKTAIVTGGSGGIGTAISRRLAEMGYDTAICYRSGREKAEAEAAALRERGFSAFALKLDVSDEASVISGIAECEKRGPLAVAVNNAGICVRPPGDVRDKHHRAFPALQGGGEAHASPQGR